MFAMVKPAKTRPWGVHVLRDIYSPYVGTTAPSAAMPGTQPRWVAAVAAPYPHTPVSRIRAAWWVLTGRAEALLWPEPGDLENVLVQRPAPAWPGYENVRVAPLQCPTNFPNGPIYPL